jgi:hypothetical protein
MQPLKNLPLCSSPLSGHVSLYSPSSGAKFWGSPLYRMKTAVTSACASKAVYNCEIDPDYVLLILLPNN